MKKSKRLLAILFSVLMVLTLFPAAALADMETVEEAGPLELPSVGQWFRDSEDMEWLVLYHDADSENSLIITRRVRGANTPVFSRWDTFHETMRTHLDTWELAPEIAEHALLANGADTDYRTSLADGSFLSVHANENEPEGRTTPGAPAETATDGLFILSISEANQYFSSSSARAASTEGWLNTPIGWYLRSPGALFPSGINEIIVVGVTGSISPLNPGGAVVSGVRPALWVGLGAADTPGCGNDDCTCDPCECDPANGCGQEPGCGNDDCTCDPCECDPANGCGQEPGCDNDDCTCDPCECDEDNGCGQEPGCDNDDCTCDPCECDADDCCGDVDPRERHLAYMFCDNYGYFRPSGNITRAEVAAILARTQLRDFATETTILPDGMTSFDAFSDVGPNNWFYFYVAWAYDADLVEGFAGRFRPNEPVTRQELAAMIARLGTVYEAGDAGFPDAEDASIWAAKYVYTVYREGLMQGDENGYLRPQLNITRAEVATVVNRILGRLDSRDAFAAAEVVDLDNAREFPDLRTTAWYFPSVLAATNDHYLTRDEDGAIDWKQVLPLLTEA